MQGSCQALYLRTLFFGTLPAVLYQEFLLSGSDVRRLFCSVRNKPIPQILLFCKRDKLRFLSLSFYVSLHVVTILYVSLHVLTIPIPHVLTIPLFLREHTFSHDPSPHSLGQKHSKFYMSLHCLTLSFMFTRAS
jgi:hypothetical protein